MNSRTAQAMPSVGIGAGDRIARILLVESRAIFGPMLRRWLERRGHTLEVANDAQSGFERAVTNCPDVVLIDLGPEARSGFALATRLGTDPAMRTVPLVGMGDATTAVRDEVKRLFARHVLKPIDVDELGAVVLEVATRSRRDADIVGQSMSTAGTTGGY